MGLSTREKRQAQTRQAILDAARQIVNRNGVGALSIRGIAEQIDYSPAGLYEYFGSKEEIVQTVCQQGHERLLAAMLQVDNSLAADEYLTALGHAYINFALQYPDYYLLMFANVAEYSLSGMMSEGSGYRVLLEAIRRGVEEGVFKTHGSYGVEAMAYHAWALVHGIAMLRTTYLRDYSADFDAADHEALLSFKRGLTC